METISISEIRENYPHHWVLLGNPVLNNPTVNGSVLSKLVSGIVLFASENKIDLISKAKDLRSQVSTTACVYTGEIPKNRLFLL